jgi:hypothetical protein
MSVPALGYHLEVKRSRPSVHIAKSKTPTVPTLTPHQMVGAPSVVGCQMPIATLPVHLMPGMV